MNTKPLEKLNACEEAVEWAGKQKSAASAWKDCRRGDWMLWLLGRLSGPPESVSRKKLVLCCCECARLSLKYVESGEERPRLAIEAAEKWARGEGVTLEEVRIASAAAYAAYAAYAAARDAAYAAYAAYAASAAARDAAYAAYAASAAARDAAYAAYAADYAAAAYAAAAAADAAAAAARTKTLAACADIVRKHYPKAPSMRRERR